MARFRLRVRPLYEAAFYPDCFFDLFSQLRKRLGCPSLQKNVARFFGKERSAGVAFDNRRTVVFGHLRDQVGRHHFAGRADNQQHIAAFDSCKRILPGFLWDCFAKKDKIGFEQVAAFFTFGRQIGKDGR